MKTLETLRKLAQTQIDDIARVLATLETERRDFLAQLAEMDASREGEAFAAVSDPLMTAYFAAFSTRLKGEKAALSEQMAAVEAQIEETRGLLSAAYQEKSRYQQLVDMRLRAEAEEAARQEQNALDEFATQSQSR